MKYIVIGYSLVPNLPGVAGEGKSEFLELLPWDTMADKIIDYNSDTFSSDYLDENESTVTNLVASGEKAPQYSV